MATEKPVRESNLRIVRFDKSKLADPRLGRHVVHDDRSRRYAYQPRKGAALQSKRHQINVPILNQGNVGSCTGHAEVAVLGGEAFWPVTHGKLTGDPLADHNYAVSLYSEATRLDPWEGQYEPDDTGSDGLSVAKAALNRGLVSGYQHALSLEACLAALAERPVMIGIWWLRSMSDPGADGRIRVQGAYDGGHEICLDEIDVERERAWFRNSWGPDWGLQGRGWVTFADLGKLLADDGDCTILVPATLPPPEPTPPPPPPEDPLQRDLADALGKYLDNAHAAAYMKRAGIPWLNSLKKGKAK